MQTPSYPMSGVNGWRPDTVATGAPVPGTAQAPQTATAHKTQLEKQMT